MFPSLRDALTEARRVLDTAGIPDAALEAELLLRHALFTVGVPPIPPTSAHPEPVEGRAPRPPEPSPPLVSRSYLFSHLDEAISAPTAATYETLLTRRLAREPTAYIVGHREFYGLDLLVTPDTLIPRPETELLVEAAIELTKGSAQVTIADIGTGSGAIAVALAKALPRAVIYATDVSGAALDAARRNAVRHGVSRRIAFRRGELLDPVSGYVDVVVANLPYVDEQDLLSLEPEVREHEPRLALAGGADGLDLVRRLLGQAPHYLKPGGAILLEFGHGQADAVRAMAAQAMPRTQASIANDLAGLPRVLILQT